MSNRIRKYPRTLLAIAVASASFGAVAQDEGMDQLEEVVVTGIRGSLERSMDMKRDAQGVVDAISAEDIGKMPDTNLAESLQRITGVSIDRQNGEGSRVTVRGFGPDYNVVTLNGRQMPAANIEATSASSSRSFDFANLAAESVSAVEIYKTGKASLSTGGIGSVINIRTARPLEQDDLVANVGIKAMHDTSTKTGDSWTPEISGIFSTKFADDTMGIALTGSYSDRQSGYAKAETGPGWYTIPGGQGDWGSIAPDNPNFENAPQAGDVYAVPRGIGFAFGEIQRERTNAQATFQWAPTDKLEATLDYTFSEQDVEQQYNAMGAWFNGVPVSGAFTPGTGNGSVVALTEYTDGTGSDVTFNAGEWGTKNTNNSLGLNVAWHPTDALTLVFDYHNSSAKNGAKDDRGTNNNIAGVQYNRAATTVNYTTPLPTVSFEFNAQGPFDPSQMLTSGTAFRNALMKHDIEQAKIDGTFEFEDSAVRSIDFGLSMLESENRSAFANAQRDTWGGYGTAADYDDSLFVQKSMASALDQFSSASSPDMTPYYYASDFNGMNDAIAAIAAANGETLVGACGDRLCASNDFTTDRTTQESQKGAYVQVNLGWDDLAMPINLAVGLRYEDTKVDSKALVPQYDSIIWAADNEFVAQANGVDFTQLKGAYSNWLPNIDFDIAFTDDVVGRASVSKTISRPGYADIQGGQTIDPLVRFNGGTGSRGNPDLDPFESTNFELSVEWYYGEGSYVSAGYYKKDVENFIGQTSFEETVFDLAHPVQGPRYQQAVADLGTSDAGAVRAYMESLYGAPVEGSAADGDTAAVFRMIAPVNAETAKIDGFEVAVQHMFGESGFGAIVNFTTVNGDIAYDNFNTNKGAGVENQFALLGLSDSFNIVGFYDKNGIQARIAYNWRDDFLNSTFDGNGERNPIYTEAYGQWDVNVSYDINDNFAIFAEGINITSETQRLYGRHENMMIGTIQTGARYNLGARYTF
ncbi:TonB-dependent receptor [Simiduia agarivorans]|uniref:TonB-dependent receptor n=1 Tax=Simiduia agarivorans (strain DSM 21679 / JCM 13881 / BCRC 17597 / SA1) TaxID=1117647 RepID=K4L3L9_SIMAS|nr:TonB-dependent receptor [Simiduia agarivorans]AFV00793.1 TonB-dependent receptor [Simiduia agarivorans SA1 = DSM 21679]